MHERAETDSARGARADWKKLISFKIATFSLEYEGLRIADEMCILATYLQSNSRIVSWSSGSTCGLIQ